MVTLGVDLDTLSPSEADEIGIGDEYRSEYDEPVQVCCTSPEAAAARLCGCGGRPYI